jgi:uncharacterized protein YuzE
VCAVIERVRKDERDRVAGSAIWQITVHEETNAAYLWTTPEELDESANGLTIQRDAYLDLDRRGRVVGIEIFDWPTGRSSQLTHRFIMDSDAEMCRYCGALLNSVIKDGIHWFREEGDNG